MKTETRQRLETVNLLELAPIRVASWEENVDGRVTVERRKPVGEGVRLWLRYWLAVRRVRLDERGSFTWQLLDGSHTVAEIAERVRDRFGEAVEPAEERVGHLVRFLHREDLVRYPNRDGGSDTTWQVESR